MKSYPSETNEVKRAFELMLTPLIIDYFKFSCGRDNSKSDLDGVDGFRPRSCARGKQKACPSALAASALPLLEATSLLVGVIYMISYTYTSILRKIHYSIFAPVGVLGGGCVIASPFTSPRGF